MAKFEKMSRFWSRVMGKYRAYCFDGNAQVWVEDRFAAESDEAAILAAVAIPKAVKVELLHERRLVTVVDKQERSR